MGWVVPGAFGVERGGDDAERGYRLAAFLAERCGHRFPLMDVVVMSYAAGGPDMLRLVDRVNNRWACCGPHVNRRYRSSVTRGPFAGEDLMRPRQQLMRVLQIRLGDGVAGGVEAVGFAF